MAKHIYFKANHNNFNNKEKSHSIICLKAFTEVKQSHPLDAGVTLNSLVTG